MTGIGVFLSSEYRKIQRILLLLAIVLFLLPFHYRLLEVQSELLYAANTLILLGSLSVFFASLRQRSVFQFFTTLIGLRFVILYFQALGGLAATGVGLIISGIVILAAALLWNRHRQALTNWMEELVG